MSVLNTVRFVVYRCHEKGLEILLVSTGFEGLEEEWRLPFVEEVQEDSKQTSSNQEMIELEPVKGKEGQTIRAFAIEGDYHDIPGIRSMIKQDVRFVKNQIKKIVPEIEKGTYVAVKEAFKKVLPHEYEMLHELKEIIRDRNLLKNI